jgi:hypothetical protein
MGDVVLIIGAAKRLKLCIDNKSNIATNLHFDK